MVVRALSAPLLPSSTFHDTTLNCKVEAKESEKIREKKTGQGMNHRHLRFRESRICKADNYLPIGLFLRDFLFSSQSSLGAMIAASEWSSSPLAQRRKTIQTWGGGGRRVRQKIRLRWRLAKKKEAQQKSSFLTAAQQRQLLMHLSLLK